MKSLSPYAKTVAAVVGAGLTAASGIVAPQSTWGHVLTVALVMVTAASVYAVPNARPGVPASAAHLVPAAPAVDVAPAE